MPYIMLHIIIKDVKMLYICECSKANITGNNGTDIMKNVEKFSIPNMFF